MLAQFSGIYSYDIDTEANLELYRAPQFEQLQYIIWDLSGVEEVTMTREQAAITSMQDKLASARLPHVKMALLAPSEATRRVCTHYIGASRNNKTRWEFLVSDDMDHIRDWVSS